MNIQQLYNDYGVEIAPAEHRHNREGWVNTTCPYCTGNPGYHLGVATDGVHYYCWRCGYHPFHQTLAKLIGGTKEEAKRIAREYGSTTTQKETVRPKIQRKKFRLPSNCGELHIPHRRYLESRGFDPDRLAEEWQVKGTGPTSRLDNVNFKHRVVAPIYWQGNVVSFQTRDITNKHRLKYITCSKERELVHHKDILYMPAMLNEVGVCMEGITDVWKMYRPEYPFFTSFATFGVAFTRAQVRIISKLFRYVAVVFDPDPQAQVQARKLVAELKFRGTQVVNVQVEKDPGSMDTTEINKLIERIKLIFTLHKT